MLITPVVTQANGIIAIRLQATFVGDSTDPTDKQLIAALGDPEISLVGNGTFTGMVPGSSPPATFKFTFPTTQYYVGITTRMSGQAVRFMIALPASPAGWASPPNPESWNNPNAPAPVQGELDCVTPYPGAAMEAWYQAMVDEITAAMTALRNQVLPPPPLPVDI